LVKEVAPDFIYVFLILIPQDARAGRSLLQDYFTASALHCDRNLSFLDKVVMLAIRLHPALLQHHPLKFQAAERHF